MTQRDLETTDIGNGRIRKKTRLDVSPTNSNIIYHFNHAVGSPAALPIRYLPSSAIMASPDEIRPPAPLLLHKVK